MTKADMGSGLRVDDDSDIQANAPLITLWKLLVLPSLALPSLALP